MFGAVPPSASQVVVLGPVAISIAGSHSACVTPSNYSVVGPNGLAYQWFISGGTPAAANGNNVDVLWGVR